MNVKTLTSDFLTRGYIPPELVRFVWKGDFKTDQEARDALKNCNAYIGWNEESDLPAWGEPYGKVPLLMIDGYVTVEHLRAILHLYDERAK